LSQTEGIEKLLDHFEYDSDLHIAPNSRDRVFIHAGAVSWKGHTIVIHVPPHTGKIMLLAEFLKLTPRILAKATKAAS
jgi:hypothetical protein